MRAVLLRRGRILHVMDTLILCIGNKARGDDGVARRVAELIADRLPASAKLISTPQLDIVMAEDAAAARLVVFVDAERRSEPAIRVETQHPGTTGSHAHAIDPAGLLTLAATLYAAAPEALLVSVAGPEMDHDEGLSAIAEAASFEAASEVLRIMNGTVPD